MQIAIRNIGNSKGVVLPKLLLAQVGLDEGSVADVAIEDGAIVLRKPVQPVQPVRAGWAEAAKAVAAAGGDALLMGEFANADDELLSW